MKKLKAIFLVLAVAMAMILFACGGSVQSVSSSSTTAVVKVTPTLTPTPTPGPPHTGQSATQIMQYLKSHGFPIGVSFTYTAENDVNHLFGRPGQYIGKVNFKDTRISSTNQGVDISVRDGGSIEVFATTTDAKNRFAYIQQISKSGIALFAEYEYLDGVAILCVSAQLTPDQAKKYEATLKALP
jgi:hypothetical protein